MPANVGEDGKDQIRSKSGIEGALDRGRAAVGKDEEDYGPAVAISRGRPESILTNAGPELLEFSRMMANADGDNCGTGAGGFQPGNDCAKGAGGGGVGGTIKVKLTGREVIALGYDSLTGENKELDAVRRKASAGGKLTEEEVKIVSHDIEMLADFGADPADVATAKGLQRKAAKWRGEKRTKKGEAEDVGMTKAELDAMAARIKAKDAGG